MAGHYRPVDSTIDPRPKAMLRLPVAQASYEYPVPARALRINEYASPAPCLDVFLSRMSFCATSFRLSIQYILSLPNTHSVPFTISAIL